MILPFAFFLALAAHTLQGAFIAGFTLLPFTPFLALSIFRSSFKKTLWMAAAAGIWVDLFSDDPIGLHALNYTLICALVHSLKRQFDQEKPLSFSLYTALISASSTILQLILLFLFDRRVPFSGKWPLIDLIAMPVADGILALVWFSGPLYLFQLLRYKWMVYWLKKKSPSQISR